MKWGFLNNTTLAPCRKLLKREKGKMALVASPESPGKTTPPSIRDLSSPELWAELVQVLDPLDIETLQATSSDVDFTNLEKTYKHLVDGFDIPSQLNDMASSLTGGSSSSLWMNNYEDWCTNTSKEDLMVSLDAEIGEPPPMSTCDCDHRQAMLSYTRSELLLLRSLTCTSLSSIVKDVGQLITLEKLAKDLPHEPNPPFLSHSEDVCTVFPPPRRRRRRGAPFKRPRRLILPRNLLSIDKSVNKNNPYTYPAGSFSLVSVKVLCPSSTMPTSDKVLKKRKIKKKKKKKMMMMRKKKGMDIIVMISLNRNNRMLL